jgi:hypothetical protein
MGDAALSLDSLSSRGVLAALASGGKAAEYRRTNLAA